MLLSLLIFSLLSLCGPKVSAKINEPIMLKLKKPILEARVDAQNV